MIQGLSAIDKAISASPALQELAGPVNPGTVVETSFSDALASAAQRAVGTMEGAEALSLKALQGDANTREVVDAVMSAEQTLQAAIAIRDKIVTAYLEVSRMAI